MLSTISAVDGDHNVNIEVATFCNSESTPVFRTELDLLVKHRPELLHTCTIWLVDGDEARINVIRAVFGIFASIHLCIHHLFGNFIKHLGGVQKAESNTKEDVSIDSMDKSTILYQLSTVHKIKLKKATLLEDARKALVAARAAMPCPQAAADGTQAPAVAPDDAPGNVMSDPSDPL